MLLHKTVTPHLFQSLVAGHRRVDVHLATSEWRSIAAPSDIVYSTQQLYADEIKMPVSHVVAYKSLDELMKHEPADLLWGAGILNSVPLEMCQLLERRRFYEDQKCSKDQEERLGVVAIHFLPWMIELSEPKATTKSSSTSTANWACVCVLRTVAGPLPLTLARLILRYVGLPRGKLPFYLELNQVMGNKAQAMDRIVHASLRSVLRLGRYDDKAILDTRQAIKECFPAWSCDFCISRATGQYMHQSLHTVYLSDRLPDKARLCEFVSRFGRPCYEEH